MIPGSPSASVNSRALAVYLPAFRLERCGYGADDLAAVISEWKGAVRILATTPAAGEEGVGIGMTATEARALLPRIELVPWEESEEAIDFTALAQRFEAFSDRVEALLDHDALIVDLTYIRPYGLEGGLEGGLEEGLSDLASEAVALACSLGHTSRAAVADDPLAARALAEWVADPAIVVPPGKSADLLAPLPIRALVDDPTLIAGLRAVGIEHIGAWARLDPAAIANRYGARAARLHSIARGTPSPVPPGPWSGSRAARPPPSASVPLASATTTAEIGWVLPQALDSLERQLREGDQAAVRVRVRLQSEGPRRCVAFTVRAGRPTRSPARWKVLILARLDRFRNAGGLDPIGSVEELGIEVLETAPDGGSQPGLADRAEGGEEWSDLLARLADQLGEDAVFVPQLCDRWRPEDAWVPTSPSGSARSLAPRRSGLPDVVDLQDRADQIALVPSVERGTQVDPTRPTVVFPEPLRIEVIADDGVDVQVPRRWRGEQGWSEIVCARGPERISGEWWATTRFDREYWKVATDDRWSWIYRDSATRGWYLHGSFD